MNAYMHEKMNQLFEDAKEVDANIQRVDTETIVFQTKNGQENCYQLDVPKTNQMKKVFPDYDVCWIKGKKEGTTRYWLYMREEQNGLVIEMMFAYLISTKQMMVKYAHRKIGNGINPKLTDFHDIKSEFKKTVENLPENRLYFVTGVM